MTQTRDLIKKMADFFKGEEFYEKGEDARLELSPDDVRCMNEVIKAQPKIGHWITTRTFMHDGEYYCDKCKCDSPNNEKWDYCPHCGAKMESEGK